MSSPEPVADEPSAEPASTSQDPPPDEDTPQEEPTQPKATGCVKWFSVTKGFGFIQPDDGEAELFVHQTSILAEGFRSLREGERVEFDTELAEDGRAKAVNVTGPDGAAPQGAPRRVYSANPYPAMPAYPAYNYVPYPPRGGGRMGGRGGFPPHPYGFGRGYPPMERPPPPGTPGYSSGFQPGIGF